VPGIRTVRRSFASAPKPIRNGKQLPDGAIVWTAPTGRSPPRSDPDLMMSTRRRTGSAEREYRMRSEASLNDANVAERNKPPPF
jgi:hypothetical protein